MAQTIQLGEALFSVELSSSGTYMKLSTEQAAKIEDASNYYHGQLGSITADANGTKYISTSYNAAYPTLMFDYSDTTSSGCSNNVVTSTFSDYTLIGETFTAHNITGTRYYSDHQSISIYADPAHLPSDMVFPITVTYYAIIGKVTTDYTYKRLKGKGVVIDGANASRVVDIVYDALGGDFGAQKSPLPNETYTRLIANAYYNNSSQFKSIEVSPYSAKLISEDNIKAAWAKRYNICIHGYPLDIPQVKPQAAILDTGKLVTTQSEISVEMECQGTYGEYLWCAYNSDVNKQFYYLFNKIASNYNELYEGYDGGSTKSHQTMSNPPTKAVFKDFVLTLSNDAESVELSGVASAIEPYDLTLVIGGQRSSSTGEYNFSTGNFIGIIKRFEIDGQCYLPATDGYGTKGYVNIETGEFIKWITS